MNKTFTLYVSMADPTDVRIDVICLDSVRVIETILPGDVNFVGALVTWARMDTAYAVGASEDADELDAMELARTEMTWCAVKAHASMLEKEFAAAA